MRRAPPLVLAAAALCALVPGATTPRQAAATESDARLVELRPDAGERWRLLTCPKTAQTLLFPQGQKILSVEVSDPGAYRAGISGAGDSLVLVPSGTISAATMTVETSHDRYAFDLVPADEGSAPQVVRVMAQAELPPTGMNPAAAMRTVDAVPPDTGQYRLKGDAIIRPVLMSDDGRKTYIRWADEQPLPAVFGLGPSGEEEMVEGHMRGGTFTIDRLYARLVFRIDKMKLQADRRREGDSR